ATVRTRHLDKTRRAIQANGRMAHLSQGQKIPPRTAPEIQDLQRRLALDVAQQRRDVLRDIVIARAFPESLGVALVMAPRAGCDVLEVLRGEHECRSGQGSGVEWSGAGEAVSARAGCLRSW